MNFSVGGAGRLLMVEIGDGLTKAHILTLWDAVQSHPVYAEATSVLVLLKPGVQWRISNLELMDLARLNRRFKPMRWAIVAPDPLSFGMSRMFATQVDDESAFYVCSTEKAAREWLGAGV